MQSHAYSCVNFNDSSQQQVEPYNPEAAFYALPKAFILRLLQTLSPSTTKVFLALVYHTDPFNIIKYPEQITYKNIMAMTGIKKFETVQKAFAELVAQKIIGGFVPGHGSENTRFYFTFDIDHYNTEECCFRPEEIESYYNHLLGRKTAAKPALSLVPPAEAGNPGNNEVPDNFNNSPDADNNTVSIEGLAVDILPAVPDPGASPSEKLSPPAPGISQSISTPYSDTSPQKKGEGIPENGDPLKTILPKLINSHSYTRESSNFKPKVNDFEAKLNPDLIRLSKQSDAFPVAFSDFCVDDSSKYREKTFFWVMHHAGRYELSLADVIDSLKIAVYKDKAGQMSYLIGIMKNKAGDKAAGVHPAGKSLSLQVYEFVKQRLGVNVRFFRDISFRGSDSLVFQILNAGDKAYMSDYLSIIISEVNNKFKTSIAASVVC